MQEQDIPYGCCHCGCGEKTRISPKTDLARGTQKGKPQRYLKGHAWRGRRRTTGPDYLVDESGCWVWQRCKIPKGYGQKVLPGQIVLPAHRWYYEQAKGPIPAGLQLDHLCRNRACVNPDHLEPVTNTENVRRGNSTPLTPHQVREIRAAPRDYGTGRALARKYNVSDACISSIRHRHTWADLEEVTS